MTDEKSNQNKELVSCEICLAEIPRSEAKVEEASDYVAYFCGLECYDKWRKGNEEKGADSQ